jgi:predicted RNA binding protein YcfA (HicA-like mRNA interferase family)
VTIPGKLSLRCAVQTSGDHRIYRSRDERVTVVSAKLGNDVRRGTWRAILKRTGIEKPEK